MHARAVADFAVNANMPARLSHETVDLAKAKAGSFAARLGREEGLEDLSQHVLAHAASGVSDRYANMRSRNL